MSVKASLGGLASGVILSQTQLGWVCTSEFVKQFLAVLVFINLLADLSTFSLI